MSGVAITKSAALEMLLETRKLDCVYGGISTSHAEHNKYCYEWDGYRLFYLVESLKGQIPKEQE